MKEYSNKLPTELPLSEFLRFYGRRLKILFAVTLANFALIGLAYLLTILGTRLHATPKPWEWLVELILILVGIVLTHVLILYSQFYKESQGYMLRAVFKIWPFLLMFLAIEWAIGAFFFNLSLALPPYALVVPAPLLGVIIGIIVAVIPSALESIFLPNKGATVKTLKRPLTRVLLGLNIVLRYNYAWAIESCRQQDLFDCQQPDGWGLDIPPVEIGRRIRKLYEFCKFRIAEERQDPSFLRYDVGRTPWEKFFLLTRHLGRKRLRQYIKNPPAFHFPNWNGSERRRTVGTRADRDPSRNPDLSPSRRYDDPELTKSIAGGRKSVSPPDNETSTVRYHRD